MKKKSVGKPFKLPDIRKLRQLVNSHNYIAKMRLKPGELSVWDILTVLAATHGYCPYCGNSLGDDYWLDHVKPYRLKDCVNAVENITFCCPDCNRRKSDKHPARWAAEQIARGFQTPQLVAILREYNLEPLVQQALCFETRQLEAEAV